MPLIINVGVSRKSSKDFQSTGYSINLSAELDSSILTDVVRLQSEIQSIYAQASSAVDRQLAGTGPAAAGPVPQLALASVLHPRLKPAFHSNGVHGVGRPSVRSATDSQLRALKAIARHLPCDLDLEAVDEFGIPAAELDVRQASRLIDLLKQRQGSNLGGHEQAKGRGL